jgi:hypothetical protein
MFQTQTDCFSNSLYGNSDKGVIKKLSAGIIVMLLMIAMFFTSLFGFFGTSRKTETALAAETSSSSSTLSGIMDLVVSKGGELLKDNLPTIGDFLASTVFDAIGIDYTDSYTKKLAEVTSKLEEIHSDIKTLLNNQQDGDLRTYLNSFYDTIDVISSKVYPIYCGYNTLMRMEKDKKYSEAEAAVQEKSFYELNLQNLLLGTSVSTGALDTQINTLAGKVIQVATTQSAANINVVDLFTSVYKPHWAFDSQSIEPTRNFLSYVSATLLESATLFEFQCTYELNYYTQQKLTSQLTVINNKWSAVKTKVNKAFALIKTYYDKISETENYNKTTATVLHYATNTRFSTKLYVAQNFNVSKSSRTGYPFNYNSPYLVYREKYQSSNTYSTVKSFNQSSLVDTFVKEYKTYCSYYGKSSDYTFNNYIKEVGFTSDSAYDGFYRNWSYEHTGNLFTTEKYHFNLYYAKLDGDTNGWVGFRIKLPVGGSADLYFHEWLITRSLASFVKADGYLYGSYDEIYSTSGSTIPNALGLIFNTYSRQSQDLRNGKVR